jgi:hypothetical protein
MVLHAATLLMPLLPLVPSAWAQQDSLSLAGGAHARVANSPQFAGQAFTFSAWITPLGPGLGGDGTIIAKPREGSSGNNLCSWWLGWSSSSLRVTGLVVHEFATSGAAATTVRQIPLGQPAHIAMTFDGATIRLYVNGTLDASAPFNFSGVYYGTEPVLIGASNLANGFTWYYQGTIDDLRVWNRALSAAEVSSLVGCEGSGPASGLVAAWTFNNASLTDVSGNGHHATPTGAVAFAPESRPPCCPADFDDGSGTGTLDGGVGIEDLLFYLDLYSAGAARADVDDGSGTGTHDGGVGIEDLLYYLQRYDAGC